MTVWQSDLVESGFETAVVPAELFTTYNCKVAALNSHGVGSHGSLVLVHTPEAGTLSHLIALHVACIAHACIIIVDTLTLKQAWRKIQLCSTFQLQMGKEM